VQLSPQQETALGMVSNWLRNGGQTFYLAGYAGTGKTTIAQYIAQQVKGTVLYAAFTGKAASVMAKAGCLGAQTIHSLIYVPAGARGQEIAELQERIDKETDPRQIKILLQKMKDLRRPHFSINQDSALKGASLLILDECSMVNDYIAKDLLSFKRKVLVLGDPAQLPPVRGAGHFTKNKPDFLLTEIHRQAADNPIVAVATAVREGRKVDKGALDERVQWYKADDFKGKDLMTLMPHNSEVQVLTGYNSTRTRINKVVRRYLFTSPDGTISRYPEPGDKLVCLKNDKDMGLLNGVQAFATAQAVWDPIDECFTIDLLYDGRPMSGITISKDIFDSYWDNIVPKCSWSEMEFDYAYAMTVHKAQGSQWGHVIIRDDGFKDSGEGRRRWLYTAVTRATERLTMVY
jgi:ATP-dependent exoDNAse (exonuclease V) alpha subunit